MAEQSKFTWGLRDIDRPAPGGDWLEYLIQEGLDLPADLKYAISGARPGEPMFRSGLRGVDRPEEGESWARYLAGEIRDLPSDLLDFFIGGPMEGQPAQGQLSPSAEAAAMTGVAGGVEGPPVQMGFPQAAAAAAPAAQGAQTPAPQAAQAAGAPEGVDPEKVNAWDKILEAMPFDMMATAIAMMRDKRPGESAANIMGEALGAGYEAKIAQDSAAAEGARKDRELDIEEGKAKTDAEYKAGLLRAKADALAAKSIPFGPQQKQGLAQILLDINPNSPAIPFIASLPAQITSDQFADLVDIMELEGKRHPTKGQQLMTGLNSVLRAVAQAEDAADIGLGEGGDARAAQLQRIISEMAVGQVADREDGTSWRKDKDIPYDGTNWDEIFTEVDE